MKFSIVDFHNDLLSYLTYKDKRTPYDTASLSSYPQLLAGHVKLQILAISTITSPTSVEMGKKQALCFKNLLKEYPHLFTLFKKEPFSPSLVCVLPAIENASAFSLEDEPLSSSLQRLEDLIEFTAPLVYISLTWNGENRFGGGVGSTCGLKEDGKELLKWLDQKKIAIDFSHASDKLSYEILNYIDRHHLNIPLIASHSNFRTITNVPRNLPEELAKELIRRKGLICLNLFAPFIDKNDPYILIKHIEYGLTLGAEDALSIGADFFCIKDFPHIQIHYPNTLCFFPQLSDSSSYPYLFSLLEEKGSFKESFLEKISSKNALCFLEKSLK